MSDNYKTQGELDAAVIEAVNEDKSSTGAACFRSINFASCSDGITKAQADKLAARMGLSVSFYPGKSCSQINCR